LGAHFSHSPQMMSLIILPQEDRPWEEPRHLSHKACISAAWFELGVGFGSRKKGEYRTGKKSRKGYISAIWGEAPIEAIYIKNRLVGDSST